MGVALRGNGMEESEVSHLMWGVGPRAWGVALQGYIAPVRSIRCV